MTTIVQSCAHCGGQAAITEGNDTAGHNSVTAWLQVRCTKCPSAMRVTEYDCNNRDGRMLRAVELWNRRVA